MDLLPYKKLTLEFNFSRKEKLPWIMVFFTEHLLQSRNSSYESRPIEFVFRGGGRVLH